MTTNNSPQGPQVRIFILRHTTTITTTVMRPQKSWLAVLLAFLSATTMQAISYVLGWSNEPSIFVALGNGALIWLGFSLFLLMSEWFWAGLAFIGVRPLTTFILSILTDILTFVLSGLIVTWILGFTDTMSILNWFWLTVVGLVYAHFGTHLRKKIN